MLVAGDVAAVLSLVGRRCSRETAMVLLARSVGTRRPEGGIGNGHDDGALKGECTTRAWSEAYSSELARMGRVFQSASLVRGGSRWDTATEVKGRRRETESGLVRVGKGGQQSADYGVEYMSWGRMAARSTTKQQAAGGLAVGTWDEGREEPLGGG
jgi:hypothetical protein